MKTLLVAPEMFRADGGIARILRVYLKALCESASNGDSVTCLVLNDDGSSAESLESYSTSALRRFSGYNRAKVAFASSVIRESRNSDRVVCGHLHLLPVVWMASRLAASVRYSLVAHGIEVWRPYTCIEKRALLASDRILCVSDYTRRQMLRFCRELNPARLVVVPNTLDPRLENHVASPSRSDSGIPTILTVGRLAGDDRYKGFDTLIEAMPEVLRRLGKARLRIVGTGDDVARLKRIATAGGVASNVDFLGRISDEDLRAEYHGCEVFALPSRKEGFGLVYLEAMTHGKPCLGAKAGGAPEVINDDVGALVDYGDVSGIAQALCDLLVGPKSPENIRRHAQSFAYPTFKRRLAASLS